MRRRHRRLQTSPELDITAFMNLMIVLVPVLLLGMVFSQVRMIDLNFPGPDTGEALEEDSLSLVVVILSDGMEVTNRGQGVIRSLPMMADQVHDIEGLRNTLKAIKRRVPDKTDIVLEVAGDVDYQTLVTMMDTVRSYTAVVAASVVEAELFPDVSLATAPDNRQLTAAVTGGRL